MAENPHLTLKPALVEATRKGPVQDWIERIAAIAASAGLPLERIQWQGSPINVASEVVEAARRHGILDTLKQAIEDCKPSDAAAVVKDDNPLLDLSPDEFFTKKRFVELGVAPYVADRAFRGAREMVRNAKSMREFLAERGDRYALRKFPPPNCGRKSLDAIILAITLAGLPFKDSE